MLFFLWHAVGLLSYVTQTVWAVYNLHLIVEHKLKPFGVLLSIHIH